MSPEREARAAAIAQRIVDAMDQRPALSRPGLLSKLEGLLGARRMVFATSGGTITDERAVDDNAAQLRALNMALLLRGEFPSRAVDVSVTARMEQLPDLGHLPSHELMKLAGLAGPAGLADDGDAVEADVVGVDSDGADDVTSSRAR